MPKRDLQHMAAQRDRILRAAIICIAEQGLAGTSISTISRQAELSTGALYVHFRNKDDIIAEAVRTRSSGVIEQAPGWREFKRLITAFDAHADLDIVTMVRARLHLNAEAIRPGPLRDLCRQLVEASLASVAGNLQMLQSRGQIVLRRSAKLTATDIGAYIDGMLWIGLATGMPQKKLRQTLMEGLDAFVDRPREP